MIPPNFQDWARSLSGCDGGNLAADTWLCGIEWGGGSYGDGIYYREDLPKEISRGTYKPESKYDWEHSFRGRSPFGRNFAKLYAAMEGEEDVGAYREIATSKWNGSEIFKLNLYPIAFDSVDPALWRENGLGKVTGFADKYAFQAWCMFERFPEFAALRKTYNPRTIICVGVGYFREFLLAFGANAGDCAGIQNDGIIPVSSSNKPHARQYHWVKIGDTNLVVIPFFSGSNGLNSNYLLKEMGTRIRNLRLANAD